MLENKKNKIRLNESIISVSFSRIFYKTILCLLSTLLNLMTLTKTEEYFPRIFVCPCIVSMLLSADVNRNHIYRFVFYYAVYLHSARVPARYFLPKRSVCHDKEIFESPCLLLLRRKHLLPGYCDSSEAFSLLPLLFSVGFLLFFVEIFLRLQNSCFFPLVATIKLPNEVGVLSQYDI